MQIPIINGIYTDGTPDFRTSYPRNLVPVPKQQGISQGYLKQTEGLSTFATGPGVGRGGIWWRDQLYRVMGTKLVNVKADGTMDILGDVGAGGPVSMDYSPDALAIASGGRLYYYDRATVTRATDVDFGKVKDVLFVDGYFMTTDGTFLVVTELNDRMAVNPLKYGSSEADPDKIVGIVKIRNEVYAVNRYTVEVFDNVGGTNFPFARIEGGQVQRGAIGTKAIAKYLDSVAFLGSGRNEAPAVYLIASGVSYAISTREIDQILKGYTEEVLATVEMESRVYDKHHHLYIHLPDQTLVYDGEASKSVGEPVWFVLSSAVTSRGKYRARHFTWAYGKWMCDDTDSSVVGYFDESIGTHFGQIVGWEMATQILYTEGRGGVLHEMELMALPGRVPLGPEPVIYTSYSNDGLTWSQETPAKAGKLGQYGKRICWRRLGRMAHRRIQKFRGADRGRVAFAALDVVIEPLNG